MRFNMIEVFCRRSKVMNTIFLREIKAARFYWLNQLERIKEDPSMKTKYNWILLIDIFITCRKRLIIKVSDQML